MKKNSIYSLWFIFPCALIFTLFFLVPLLNSVFYSFTVWDFVDWDFVGFDNYVRFFSDRSLRGSIIHTLVYAFMTSGIKVVLAFFIAIFLTGELRNRNFLRAVVFFPNIVSTVAVGITFAALMHPTKGLFNVVLKALGFAKIDFLGNTDFSLYSVIFTDVWKGLSVATVMYIAGLQSIDRGFYEAAELDGASKWDTLRYVTLPLLRPTVHSVIILSLIGGLRSVDLILTMTNGGPGFATEVIATTVYKQYSAGYYGLSTAGTVIMFIMIGLIAYPLQRFFIKREEGLE